IHAERAVRGLTLIPLAVVLSALFGPEPTLRLGEIAMMRRTLLVGLSVLLCLPAAHAADQMVLGSSLVVKNPGTPEKRKINVIANERTSDDTLVGDPVSNGASVTIDTTGGTATSATYALPAGTNPANQKPFWTGDASKGFKYSDPKGANGPVKSAIIKLKGTTFQIKVAVDGKLGPVGILPPDPGMSACVLFTIVGGDSYSVQFA